MEPYPKAYLYKRIVQAKMLMDERFMEPIDVEFISGEAAFSHSHFIRLFKQVYGVVPRVYLSNLRIAHAKQMLEGGSSVADACLKAGFQSIPTFTRAFKRRTGHTPAVYRELSGERDRHMQASPLEHIPNCYAGWLGWPKKGDPG